MHELREHFSGAPPHACEVHFLSHKVIIFQNIGSIGLYTLPHEVKHTKNVLPFVLEVARAANSMMRWRDSFQSNICSSLTAVFCNALNSCVLRTKSYNYSKSISVREEGQRRRKGSVWRSVRGNKIN